MIVQICRYPEDNPSIQQVCQSSTLKLNLAECATLAHHSVREAAAGGMAPTGVG